MKKIKNSPAKYYVLSSLTMLIDVVLIVIVLAGFVGMVHSTYNIIIAYIHEECSSTLTNYISNFGVYSSISLVSVSSIILSLVLAYRSSINEIENDLAKCTHLNVQIKSLPEGADIFSSKYLQAALLNENEINHSKDKHFVPNHKTLKDFDYQLNINFKQDIAEFYTLSLCDLEFINVNVDQTGKYVSQSLPIRTIETLLETPCIVKDNAGVNSQNDGEQIVVFFSESVNKTDQKKLRSFLHGNNQNTHRNVKRVLRFKLNFLKNDYSQSGWVLFPILRNMLNTFLQFTLRRRVIVVEMEFSLAEKNSHLSAQTITKNFSTFNASVIGLQIMDVGFKVERNLTWTKYLKLRNKNRKHS